MSEESPAAKCEPCYPILHRMREIIAHFQFNSSLPSDLDELLTLTRRGRLTLHSFDATSLRCFAYLLFQTVFCFLPAGDPAAFRPLLAELDGGMRQALLITPQNLLLCALIEPIVDDAVAVANLKLLMKHFEWTRGEIEPLKDHFTSLVFAFLISICD